MASLTFEALSFAYPQAQRRALDEVSLTIGNGEFAVLCGRSGCGKSTLLRHCKTVLTPHGRRKGRVLFGGVPLDKVSFRDQSEKIGFVLQNPDNQIVTDKVWHELAFGLESLGEDQETIRLRVAEMASFFGIQKWFLRNVSELSGGQKQLLNLASIMAMQPELLVLDEPTSQLDPIAASEFLETVKKINRELGTTVLLTEHRLEEAFPMADRVIVMEDGAIIADGEPGAVGDVLKESSHDLFCAMPAAMQIYAQVDGPAPCPLTVRDGRRFLSSLWPETPPEIRRLPVSEAKENASTAVEIKEVWFRYEKDGDDVVKGLNLTIPEGCFYAIVGGNGTGKTTTINLMSGIQRPYRGKIRLFGKEIQKYKDSELFTNLLGVLPQNPQALFVKKTVRLDLLEMLSQEKGSKEEKEERILEAARQVEIEDLLERHPYDLSGGEQQRAALAKVLMLKPRILLMDEPTKGLDNAFKDKLAGILNRLKAGGVTIVMVSHDIEFCARYADRCAMFFDGSVVTENTPNRFFSGNSFYTTSANRMSRHLFENAVTVEDVITLCRQNLAANA